MPNEPVASRSRPSRLQPGCLYKVAHDSNLDMNEMGDWQAPWHRGQASAAGMPTHAPPSVQATHSVSVTAGFSSAAGRPMHARGAVAAVKAVPAFKILYDCL